jgi:hypothetical protein
VSLTVTATEITSDLVSVRADFRPHAAADGGGAWVVSDRPNRLLTEDEAVRVMQYAEDKAAGPCQVCGHSHAGLECASCPEGYCEAKP